MNPDIELRHEILEALNWDPIACTAGVGVRVESGVVTLTGELPDQALKAAVECAVRRVPAASGFVNELRVRPASAASIGTSGQGSAPGPGR